MAQIKTPEQIAADAIVAEHRRDGEAFPRDWDAIQRLIERAIEADRAQRTSEERYDQVQQAIALAFEGEGEAWSDRLSGDRLASVARRALEERGL